MRDMAKHVAVANIPEELVDPAGDGLRSLKIRLSVDGRGMPCGGAKGKNVEAVQVQPLAASAEQVLPVGAFLHAKHTALVEILAGVPREDRARRVHVRRKK